MAIDYTTEELAWLAGFVDGEGYVGLPQYGSSTKTTHYKYSPRLSIGNTNKKVIEYIVNKFGGTIYEQKCKKKQYKKVWCWRLYSKKAAYILKLIYPYLKVKKENADIIFEFIKLLQISTKSMPEEIAEKRYALYLSMRQLNNGKGNWKRKDLNGNR